MADREIMEKIAEYLKAHRKITLATVTREGKPLAHTVEYASEGAAIYFVTMKTSRKAQNILNDPHVAYAVDEDYDDWTRIQGVQMEGVATILTGKAEVDRAAGIYLGKFPIVASLPPNPNMVFVKIEPSKGFFLDYLKGLMHRDPVVY